MYGHKCEYCDGFVHKRVLKREAFKHRDHFVIIENAPIGICDKCRSRYYHSSLLRRIAEIGANKVSHRLEQVPVAIYA
ncbi:MAG: YgiT-type zinc finger protein [Ardenticatenaceae bacterium]